MRSAGAAAKQPRELRRAAGERRRQEGLRRRVEARRRDERMEDVVREALYGSAARRR
ncbi:MAG TPA: hypothetical protein VLA98_06285 [Solirubrobacteraceae bacterium]|nr:hypothetical protein [Solirubrobacteraceae bacterium]